MFWRVLKIISIKFVYIQIYSVYNSKQLQYVTSYHPYVFGKERKSLIHMLIIVQYAYL